MLSNLYHSVGRWARLPLGLMLLFLQRTPVLRFFATGGETSLLHKPAEVLRGFVMAAAALGAVDTLAGATSGGTNGTVSATPSGSYAATVGTSFVVAFTEKGSSAKPGSWNISSGSLPDGCYLSSSRTATSGVTTGYANTSATTVYVLGTPTTVGTYTFTVTAWQYTSGGGGSTSLSYTVKVSAATTVAPGISTQPADQTVLEGNSFSLSVSATGTAPLTYQWYKDSTAISGATSSTYSVSSATTSDSGAYKVTVTNTAGSATSNSVTVSVGTAPVVTTAPASAAVVEGGSVTLSVTATGTGTLAYQWKKDGVAVSGATSSSLTWSSLTTSDAGTYTVDVTNSFGSITSSAATLTVLTLPTVTTSPQATTVTEGASLNLSVAISGSTPLTYQWYLNGVAISGATSATYSVSSSSLENGGSYTVTATNAAGTVTTEAVDVVVTPTVSFTSHPLSQTAIAGTSCSLSVTTSSSDTVTYQWYKDAVALSGQTSATLSFATLATGDAGIYHVVASAAGFSHASRPAQITVATPNAGHLVNMSVRSVAGVGGNPLIAGFNVANGSKNILVRVNGAILGVFGVTGYLNDPMMTVYDSSQNAVASNDNWGDGGLSSSLSSTFASVGAFAWSDASSKDAALVTSMTGNRTVLVNSAVSGESGVVLVEAYDAGTGTTTRLSNLSVRNVAGTGDQTLIVGFVIDGNVPKPILLRAVGPTLTAFGITTAMKNPRLTLNRSIDGVNSVVAENDNWSGEPGASTSAFADFGAFGLLEGSKDAALVVTLPPGQYTAVATSSDGSTGEVLVEAYEHL